MIRRARWITTAAAILLAGVVLGADTLVLRNGTRVQGELVSATDRLIEFEDHTGVRRRVRQFDKADVLRIEFDDRRPEPEPAPGRPAGMREKLVIVSGDVAWNDAGIDVRAGQEIYLESSGTVRWGPNRRHGPAGELNSPRNDARPMPTRNAAALIGKIGANSTDFFFLGDAKGPIRLRASGRLFLGVNDDNLQDNSMNFRVIVYY
jgi:hypothetical protein